VPPGAYAASCLAAARRSGQNRAGPGRGFCAELCPLPGRARPGSGRRSVARLAADGLAARIGVGVVLGIFPPAVHAVIADEVAGVFVGGHGGDRRDAEDRTRGRPPPQALPLRPGRCIWRKLDARTRRLPPDTPASQASNVSRKTGVDDPHWRLLPFLGQTPQNVTGGSLPMCRGMAAGAVTRQRPGLDHKQRDGWLTVQKSELFP
jgi:hypothetical protein